MYQILQAVMDEVGDDWPAFEEHPRWRAGFDELVMGVRAAVCRANCLLSGLLESACGKGALPLISELDESSGLSAVQLAWWLSRPEEPWRLGFRDLLRIEPSAAGASLSTPARRFRELPAGARYVFGVNHGCATVAEGCRSRRIASGARWGVLAQDFERVEARFPTGANQVSFFRFGKGEVCYVSGELGPVDVATWECGCGSWDCSERHRLSAWKRQSEPLEYFINSAINGRKWPISPKSFKGSMYYAYLSREGWEALSD